MSTAIVFPFSMKNTPNHTYNSVVVHMIQWKIIFKRKTKQKRNEFLKNDFQFFFFKCKIEHSYSCVEFKLSVCPRSMKIKIYFYSSDKERNETKAFTIS